MELKYQIEAIDKLKKLSDSDRHSIIIEGAEGSGKTYLAKLFSDFKHIDTFNVIDSKVSSLKDAIESSLQSSGNQVVCIENLDKGVNAASQVILKYLEEPLPNIYIIVTCSNLSKLPGTIISRSISVKINPPLFEDLEFYAKTVNERKYNICKLYHVFKQCKSLNDVRFILNLSVDELQYYDNLNDSIIQKNDISSAVWNLSHYEDNTKSNLAFSLRMIYKNSNNDNIKRLALSALMDLEFKRIGEHLILSKFVMNCKH